MYILHRPRQPKIQTSLLAVARSSIGYEIFDEAVDSGYIRSKTLGESEVERVLNLVMMGAVRIFVMNCRQGVEDWWGFVLEIGFWPDFYTDSLLFTNGDSFT